MLFQMKKMTGKTFDYFLLIHLALLQTTRLPWKYMEITIFSLVNTIKIVDFPWRFVGLLWDKQIGKRGGRCCDER